MPRAMKHGTRTFQFFRLLRSIVSTQVGLRHCQRCRSAMRQGPSAVVRRTARSRNCSVPQWVDDLLIPERRLRQGNNRPASASALRPARPRRRPVLFPVLFRELVAHDDVGATTLDAEIARAHTGVLGRATGISFERKSGRSAVAVPSCRRGRPIARLGVRRRPTAHGCEACCSRRRRNMHVDDGKSVLWTCSRESPPFILGAPQAASNREGVVEGPAGTPPYSI